MRICIINNLYKPFNRGGAEKIIENVIAGLMSRGHEVFLITTKPYIKIKYKDASHKIYYVNSLYYIYNKIPKVFRVCLHVLNFFDISKYYQIKKIFQIIEPEIVFTHNVIGLSFLIPRIIKKQASIHIHTLHDIQLLHPSGLLVYKNEKLISSNSAKIYQMITSKMFNCTDYIISPSTWLLDLHISKNFFKKSKQNLVKNPINSQSISVYNKRTRKNNNNRFIFVGQVEAHKGIELLLECWQELLESNQNVVLDIVGVGQLFNKLKQKYINKNIHFHGYLSGTKLYEALLRADCLIVPSLCYENFPTVICEALSLGLPVIGSRLAGIQELLHLNKEYLFEPGNKNKLKEKILLFLRNRKYNYYFDYNTTEKYIDEISKITGKKI